MQIEREIEMTPLEALLEIIYVAKRDYSYNCKLYADSTQSRYRLINAITVLLNCRKTVKSPTILTIVQALNLEMYF